MKDLHLTERRTRRCRLDDAEAAYLLAHHRGQLDLVPEGGGVWRVTPGGFAGVIRTPRRRVVIRPRVPASNLPWLLGLRDAVSPGVAACESPVLEMAALALADELDVVAAGGMHRAYRRHETAGPALVGTLDAATQMRAPPERRAVLHGVADDLTAEIPCNLVPAALGRLLTASAIPEAARARLRASLAAWPAGDTALTLPEGAPPRYGPLLRLCAALLASPGDGAMPSLLVSMERLWEAHLFRVVQAAGLPCVEQRSFTACEADGARPAVAMRPDVAVLAGERVALALDAKWKRLPDGAVVTEDFYQALAYAAALGCRRAVLVYPGRRRAWDFALAGVEILVRAVPVCGPLHRCRRAARRLGRELLRRARA